MSTTITTPGSLTAETLETVLLDGDLAKLTAAQRLQYYQRVCESLHLNPLTQPFAYIKLNNKLTLYAKRDCTDQLRQIRNISITIPSREVIEDCYVVTAQAKDRAGRQDESLGAVSIGGLKGENRSNAMMKAETKAKRRVTLSICGLAFLDESELESVQGATHVTVDATGEIGAEVIKDTWQAGKERASKMAEEKIAKLEAGEPYTGPEPPLEETLEASADKAKAQKKNDWFSLLRAFGELHARYSEIGADEAYYKTLGRFGVEKSNQFEKTSKGFDTARKCFRAMGKELPTLEHAPEYMDWNVPDDLLGAGQPLRIGGVLFVFSEDSGNYRALNSIPSAS